MEFTVLFEYLTDAIPELEFGRNLFINSLPTDLGNERLQVLFRDTYTGIQIDNYIEDYRYGRIAMSVRGYDYMETRSFAQKLSKALTIVNLEIGDLEIKHMRPLSEPVGFMNSEGGYHEFMVNFYTVYGLDIHSSEDESEQPEDPIGSQDEPSEGDSDNG